MLMRMKGDKGTVPPVVHRKDLINANKSTKRGYCENQEAKKIHAPKEM